MKNNKIKKARLKLGAFVSRMIPRAMVLIYHRVATLESDPQELGVTPENFDKHMDIISRYFYPISLTEMVNDLKCGAIRSRAVVVTFDDGYQDNYKYARPILERYGIPATIFVSSSYSGAKREFWWDELDRLILSKEVLPEYLSIRIKGKNHYWNVVQNNNSRVGDKTGPLTNELYKKLCSLFMTFSAKQIDSAIDQLRELLNDDGSPRKENLPMTAEQLRILNNEGLIEIGAHTRTHVNLGRQSVDKQMAEIKGSKLDLESILGDSVDSFSYPFGTLNHYTDHTVKCVKEAGFSNGVANFSTNVTRFTNLYEIPRRMVRNWSDAVFEERLHQYYSGLDRARSIVRWSANGDE